MSGDCWPKASLRCGERAALVREALRRRLAPQWETLHQEIGLQQIHVHLAPETTSFLCMRAPEAFGDALRHSRQLVPDVQRDGQRRSGFEIGPSYAGVMGRGSDLGAGLSIRGADRQS